MGQELALAAICEQAPLVCIIACFIVCCLFLIVSGVLGIMALGGAATADGFKNIKEKNDNA